MSDSTPENLSTLKAKVMQSFSLLIIREFLIKILSFGGNLILARILLPQDFGYFVIISFIISLVSLFSDIGLSPAIIQREKEPTQKQLSSIFFLKILLGIGLIALIFVFSPYIRFIYSSFKPVHVNMLRIFSFTLLTMSIESVPISLLERKISYSAISRIDVFGVVVYYASLLSLAFSGYGIWSFIYASIIKEISELILTLLYSRWFPSFYFNLYEIKDMIIFGVYIQAGGILSFLSSSMIPVIGGIKSGPKAAGLLDWSSTIAGIPESVTSNFGRVAFAGFSRIQNDSDLLSKSIEQSIRMLSIIMFLFAVLIFSFSYDIVRILYTNVWLQGVPYLYWFSGSIFFHAVMASYGQGILVLGKSKAFFKITILSTIFTWILALVLVVLFGPIGIAISSFISSILLFIFCIMIADKAGIHVNLIQIFSPKILVTILCFISALAIRALLPQSMVFVFGKIIVTVILYVLFMILISKEDMINLLKMIKSGIKNLRYG